jgi:hypothetical protein
MEIWESSMVWYGLIRCWETKRRVNLHKKSTKEFFLYMTGNGEDMSIGFYFRWTKVEKCDIFETIQKIIIKRPGLSAISIRIFCKEI